MISLFFSNRLDNYRARTVEIRSHCCVHNHNTAETRRWPDAVLMLGQRLRRLPDINPASDQLIVFRESHQTDDHPM